MIAYKVLETDGTGRLSGFRWPLPGADPGAWVDADVVPCRSGVHALRPVDLPYWLGPAIFEIELDGSVEEVGHKIVGPRGRLVRQVVEWNDDAKNAFSALCIDRARELASAGPATLGDWVNSSVETGPILLGYIAERIAEEAGGAAAARAERELQARWLAERLDLRG